MHVRDDSVAKSTTKNRFLVLVGCHVGQVRGRGSLRILPGERLRWPENEINFYSACAHVISFSSMHVRDDSVAKSTTKNRFLVLVERHVGRHCGRDFKFPWPRGWPLGWPESTEVPFFVVFLFAGCLMTYSQLNWGSQGHPGGLRHEKTRVAWRHRPFLAVLVGLTGLTALGRLKMGEISLQHGARGRCRTLFAFVVISGHKQREIKVS